MALQTILLPVTPAMPPINIVILQPPGYVHSLGFVDHARYFRYQFRRLGAVVSLRKNRLREDAVNVVFGAHLGFPGELLERHACVFVNLEQLGAGGANLPPDYLALLRSNVVVDYMHANTQAYAHDPSSVRVIHFGHAPYLQADTPEAKPLSERPVDLLFFGSMNDRRKLFINRVAAAGAKVQVIGQPLYGKERDELVRNAKAVLNCHYYETSRFEQARAFQSMSLGTPVISERTSQTQAPQLYEDTVFWLDEDSPPEAFFGGYFGSADYFTQAARKLQRFEAHDPQPAYAQALQTILRYWDSWSATHASTPLVPRRINLGSGKDYKMGWLNLDILERAEPDMVLDLAQPLNLPLNTTSLLGGRLCLSEGEVEMVYANNVLEHVPDLPMLMTNILRLLKLGGQFLVEVPYEHAPTAWQDPTHVRALNERSWVYYTDWFWYLGWMDHRFEVGAFNWLDDALNPCDKAQAAFMRVGLRKIATTPAERTNARAMRPDFGGLEEDWPA